MSKEFNIIGPCFPDKHFMVDIEDKLEQIYQLIVGGKYFTINRPRQYGKTTTLFQLEDRLKEENGYLAISISLEGIGEEGYRSEKSFIKALLSQMEKYFLFSKEDEALKIMKDRDKIDSLNEFDRFITDFISKLDKKLVLIIDEVDKSSNNQLFLDFLGLLRNKYLLTLKGRDYTFHSIILAGVHDVKNLKLKLRSNDDRSYNSPWNIAVDFKVDLLFNREEIKNMLIEYSSERKIELDLEEVASEIYYYTSGHPFLVSKLCKLIDEDILVDKDKGNWEKDDITFALKRLLVDENTNFESLIKNLENNKELYRVVYDLIIDGKEISYNIHNPIINLGKIYGLFKKRDGKVKVQNRIYQQLIYNYMISKVETAVDMDGYNYSGQFIEKGQLNFKNILLKFQEFMKEQYSKKDETFLERNGRLLFLAFLKPIINGRGFDFKEVQISEEKRLDVVITYLDQKYIVELKLWRGQQAHQRGLEQLSDYLERTNLDKGYLVIFDFRKQSKNWQSETTEVDGKEIFTIHI